MNEDALNLSMRKFLKKVGVTSQREIEQAVRAALESGRLKGNETLPARVMLKVDGIGLEVEIKGDIGLE
jgi:ribosomal protein L1